MADDAKEKCDILHDEDVFGLHCLENVDVAYYHAICMYDMCIRKSPADMTPLCRAATAMAHACTSKGFDADIDLDGSMALNNCPCYGNFHCENTEQLYVEKAPLAGSCYDLQYYNYDNGDISLAGCACHDGYYLDAYGSCVPPADCTCVDDYYGDVKNAGEISKRGCANW